MEAEIVSDAENRHKSIEMEDQIVSDEENQQKPMEMEEEIISDEEKQAMAKLEQKKLILSLNANKSEETITSTITTSSVQPREATRFSDTLEKHFFEKLTIHETENAEEDTTPTEEDVNASETEDKRSERVSADTQLSDSMLSEDIQIEKYTPRASKSSAKKVSINATLKLFPADTEQIEEKMSPAASLPPESVETPSEIADRLSVAKDEISVPKKECFPEQLSFQILNVKQPLPEIRKKLGINETRFTDLLPEKNADVSWLDELDADEEERMLRFDYEEVHKPSTVPAYKEMRFEYGRCPRPCERFMNVEDYAKILIDEITDEALSREKNLRQQTAIKIVEGIEYAEDKDLASLSITSIGTYVCVLEWPTIEQFSVEVGSSKIGEFLSYWKLKEDWKYCINFLYGESDAACDFYRYEAIFSIPCKQYPIAQATASVYFTFEVSRIRPRSCLVDVYYCFEGQRSLHTPGIFTFQEERLFHIVDAKLKFYKTLTF